MTEGETCACQTCADLDETCTGPAGCDDGLDAEDIHAAICCQCYDECAQ